MIAKLNTLQTNLAVAAAMMTPPIPALAADGSVDPGTSLQNLLTYGLTLAGIVIAIVCIVKGITAVCEGRHIGPILIGLVVGTVICFGGAALVSHAGGGGGIAL